MGGIINSILGGGGGGSAGIKGGVGGTEEGGGSANGPSGPFDPKAHSAFKSDSRGALEKALAASSLSKDRQILVRKANINQRATDNSGSIAALAAESERKRVRKKQGRASTIVGGKARTRQETPNGTVGQSSILG